MSKAVELFTATPRCCNCAQAVALGADRPDLAETLGSCGGGRAPGGVCGALYAALLLVPERAAEIRRDFAAKLGADTCAELKGRCMVPCVECVRTAAELAAKES